MNDTDIIRLTALRPGQSARIHAVHTEDGFRQRLCALGFRVGRQIQVVRSAAFRGPVQLRVGSASLILRHRDAHGIEVVAEA